MRTIRIYLAEDHTVVRQAVRGMLEAEPDMAVVGEAGDGAGLLGELPKVEPDLLLLDIKMPKLRGLRVIETLLQDCPGLSVIVFTMYNNPTYVYEAVSTGASGYLLKSVDRDTLLRAIRAVGRGRGFLQDEVTMPLLKRLAARAREDQVGPGLSERELQVLELLSEGKSNKEIGMLLGISDETVKVHLRRIYAKLGASDRAHAVAIASRQKFIE